MASNPKLLVLFLLLTLSCSHLLFVTSYEFHVGDSDTNGWMVPPANDSKIYNDWASEKRFKVNDTIYFKYRKDSVMEVTEIEYKKCNSTHPRFFSNNGSTIFKLDRSGLFYFISGASGHCQKGQRMIVKVLSDHDDSQSGGGGRSSSAGSTTTTAAAVSSYGGAIIIIAQLITFQYIFSS